MIYLPLDLFPEYDIIKGVLVDLGLPVFIFYLICIKLHREVKNELN